MNVIGRLPIRQKVTLSIMATTTAALLIASTAFIVADSIAARDTASRDLETMAKVIASNSAAGLIFKDVDGAHEILSGVRAQPSIVAGAIYDSNGQLFTSYGAAGAIPRTSRRDIGTTVSRTGIETYRPIAFRGQTIGTVYLASDVRDLHARKAMQVAIALMIMIVTLMIAAAIAGALQRLVTRPLMALVYTAQRVTAEKNYSIRVPKGQAGGGDDIAAVLAAFNVMLEQIESRDRRLREHQAKLEEEVQARTLELTQLSQGRKTILDCTGDGIIGMAPTGVATFVNRSASELLGAPVEEIIGTNLHERNHANRIAAGLPLSECGLCTALAGIEVRDRIIDVATFDGRIIPTEYSASAMPDPTGQSAGAVITFRDISERMAIDRMKDEFVSTVSHELRTPLSAIRGALGLFVGGLLGTFTPKGQRMLEIALSNTERLTRLINDVLDLEKLRTGPMFLNRRTANVEELIAHSIETMQPAADRAGLRIESSLTPAALHVDPDRIQQTMTNLLSNAIKFSPPQTRIKVGGTIDGDHYVVTVSDEGRGVPEDKLESIFERFRQVDSSDSRDKGGTGLGLAICRSVVTAHGGRIWCEPDKPHGSIFTFTIPLAG